MLKSQIVLCLIVLQLFTAGLPLIRDGRNSRASALSRCETLLSRTSASERTLRALERAARSTYFASLREFKKLGRKLKVAQSKSLARRHEYFSTCTTNTENEIAPVSASTNMLLNPGFEEDTSAWSLQGGASIVTSPVNAGNKSLKVISSSAKSKEVHQDFTASELATYYVSVWVNVPAAAPLSVALKWFNTPIPAGNVGNKYLIGMDELALNREASGASWKLYEGTFTPPLGTALGRLRFLVPRMNSGLPIFFDDALTIDVGQSLTPTPSPQSTLTPIPSPANTLAVTPTTTPTFPVTATPTSSRTGTPTQTLTITTTQTNTPLVTGTTTRTTTSTATRTSSATVTQVITSTSSSTPTSTRTRTNTQIAPSPTFTWTATLTGTRTATQTSLQSATNTSTRTATSTVTATRTATYTRTNTITFTPTPTSSGPNTGAIIPNVSASRNNCVAPCAVFFDATETIYNGHAADEKYLGLDYSWDFGDATAGTWHEGARARGAGPQSKNVDYGFVVAHIYESPGTYNVNLTVSDGLSSATLEPAAQITVTSADSAWPATQTICIANGITPTGGSDGCPEGALGFNEGDFHSAINSLCNIDTAPVRCLFRGGDTFSSANETAIFNTGPSYIGSYGQGKALITTTFPSQSAIRLGNGNDDLRLVDLRIVGDLSDSGKGISAGAGADGSVFSRFLSLRVDIENFDNGYYFWGLGRNQQTGAMVYDPTTRMHSQTAIVDGTVLHGAGMGGNDVFIMSNYLAIMGNRIADKRNGPNGEHVMRTRYASKAIYAHNSLGLLNNDLTYDGCDPDPNPGGAQGNTIMKFTSGFAADLLGEGRAEDGYTRQFIVSDNYISKCRFNSWDIGVGPTDESVGKSAEHFRHFVIDGNHFVAPYNERQSGSAQYIHLGNSSHFAVRNNIFDTTAQLSTQSMTGVAYKTSADQVGQAGYIPGSNGRIYNNTLYQGQSTSSSRYLINLSQATDFIGMYVSNNLLYHVDQTGQMLSFNSNTAEQYKPICCGDSCSNGIGSCNVIASQNPFVGPVTYPSRYDQFNLVQGGQGIDSGEPLPGLSARDIRRRLRPDAETDNWDAGAFEFSSVSNSDSALGTNLNDIGEDSSEWVFVDAFKASRPWTSTENGLSCTEGQSNCTIDLDGSGWVRSLRSGQVVGTYVLTDIQSQFPSGQYVVLYQGQGTIQYSGGAVRNAAASSPGRDVLDVDSSIDGVRLLITSTNPADYLRNFKIIMPGGVCADDQFKWCQSSAECGSGAACESFESNHTTQIFHPVFLNSIKNYKVLRFMNWLKTNHSQQSDWNLRPKLTDIRWRRYGPPVEIMVELANRLSADPWFCMPHLAEEPYWSAFAALVSAELNPNLKVYLEHSNEVWNGQFAQATYVNQRGYDAGLSTSPSLAGLRFHSQRSVEIFNSWEQIFGGHSRLVRVLAAQASQPSSGVEVMSWGGAHLHADALGIAPYIGGAYGRNYQSDVLALHDLPGGLTAAQQLIEAIRIDTNHATTVPAIADIVRANAQNAAARALRLVAYEGGQHLIGVGSDPQGVPWSSNTTLNSYFDAANRDPLMKNLYLEYLNAWRESGGTVFIHFQNTQRYNEFGRWGSLEFLGQDLDQAPKYQALQEFNATDPKWWVE